MRSVGLLAVASLVVAVGAVPAYAAPVTTRPAPVTTRPAPVMEPEGEGTGLWIVQLAEPPLATYRGGIRGLAPTSPRATGRERLDVAAPASVAYLDHLAARQDRATAELERRLERRVEIVYEYRNVVNGLAVRVDGAEAAALAELPGVAAVYQDVARELETDASHDLVGSAEVWTGQTGTELATRGEGVVVGMLDTGVNPDHPSFAATDGDGYPHQNPLGSGTFVGVCDPDHERHDDICNDKLIGAWSFHPLSPTARDVFGHGSHVGSTIAGNVHEATFAVGGRELNRTVQGVAPRANVISYQVCFPTCPQTSVVAAVDQAVADPTQVLNYSIEGLDDPWNDIVSLAFLDAFNAGIFVAASAGNSGPAAGTAAKTAPWNASVAATNHQRTFGHRLDATGLDGIVAVPGTGPALTDDLTAQLREAGLGCAPYEPAALDQAVALLERGECAYLTKVANAAAAGAAAVVVASDTSGPPVRMSQLERTPIPAVMVDRGAGAALRDLVAGNDPEPTTVHIGADVDVHVDEDWAQTVAWFSSRGPSRFELLAPTVAAPGVGVLAAGSPVEGNPAEYLVESGTSMASPHVAGAGALLMALHPQWSPAQVRSALAGTADQLADGAFDVGAGLVNVASAGRVGLVLDETYANFVAANPAAGGDPKQLNVPALVDHACAASCSWTRTFTHEAEVAATYTASADAPAGMSVTASPAEFTLEPGQAQTVRFTADLDPASHPAGEWALASVAFATGATHAGGQTIAPVRFPVAVVAAEPDRIAITAEAYRSRIDYHAELTWSGATSDQVDVYRDGALLATVDNHGRYVDDLGSPARGTTFTYQVCRVGSGAVCSEQASVEVDPWLRPIPWPRITTTELPDLHVLERYRHPLLATGGSGKHVWEATGLPAGLSLDPATGVLRNDPSHPSIGEATDPVEVTVSVRDATRPGPTSSATFTVEVVGVEQVAAGWGHSCAVDAELTAYCWGRDATGQIGRGVIGGDGIDVPLPEPVRNRDGDAPLTGISQIEGGDGHTCALTTSGTVYCWGASFDGRLGDGDPTPKPKPLPVAVRAPDGDGPLTGVVEIAVGWQFGCAITAGEELYCWGNNSSGRLGIGRTGGIEPLPVPVRNPDGSGSLSGVTAVAAGGQYACAVADGTPYCWGGNFQGQLGNGETSPGEPLPVPVIDVDGTGTLSDVTQLTANAGHACAVVADGTAYCWGANTAGQLGRGQSGGAGPVPARVLDVAGDGPLRGVSAIVAGDNHTCALADTAYCWGSNSWGQLGNGQLGGPDLALPAAVRAPDGTGPLPDATSLAAGSAHSCALTAVATMYCWGANYNWQLGIGETVAGHAEPLPVPTRPGPSR